MAELEGVEREWNGKRVGIAVLMVVTGSINTLAAKWADRLEADGRVFDHPFLQAVCMFIGEFFCLPVFFLVHFIQKSRWRRRQKDDWQEDDPRRPIVGGEGEEEPRVPRFNPFVFLPAALCDMCATSIMYVGLNLTYASSFQMLRGAVVIFTGLLSVAFLRSVLRCWRWLGMFVVVAGLLVVGLCDMVFGSSEDAKSSNNILTGDMLIVMAQVIVAVQMVYEQKYLEKYKVPALLAVGLEGLFGMTILSCLLIPFYFIRVPSMLSNDPEHRLENALAAFHQMGSNPLILVALGGTILSIAFFNFAGISVTIELSATTRMVLDSVRTLVIWVVSLLLSWQKFVPLQIFGFFLLILGMLIYNDLLVGPWFRERFLPWARRHGCPLWPIQRCCFPDLPSDDLVASVNADESISPSASL